MVRCISYDELSASISESVSEVRLRQLTSRIKVLHIASSVSRPADLAPKVGALGGQWHGSSEWNSGKTWGDSWIYKVMPAKLIITW